MSTGINYVVVTPVRDEVEHVGHTLKAMADQSIRPLIWAIVDDGSTDGTGQVLDDFASDHPWVTVLHRPNRGFRANGSGVMNAFYAGLEHIENDRWEFIVKLDADLSFEADYFEKCFKHFASDSILGIGGGTVCSQTGNKLRVDSPGDPPFHVRGATKIYRHACWKQIAPLVKAPGWDTLDEVRANLFGWKTRTFPELQLVQHKPTGSADGSWANAYKNGKANYLTGYHPAFMFAKCAKRMFRRPYFLNAAGLCAGFLSCYFKQLPHVADAETIRYLRQQQLKRLLLRPSIYG